MSMLKLIIKSRDTKRYFDAASLVEEVTYTTERQGTPSKLEFNILKGENLSYTEGDSVAFYVDDMPIFFGYVFEKEKRQNRIRTTCYDQLRYFKAKASYVFEHITLTEMIRQMANEFQLNVGELVDTVYQLPYRIEDDSEVFTMLTNAMNETIINRNTVYTLYDDFGKLTLKDMQSMATRYIIGDGSWASDYTYKTSIEESYSIIKLVRPNQESGSADVYSAEDPQALSDWGYLQLYQKVDENWNETQIREQLDNMRKFYNKKQRTLSIDAIGIPGLRAGNMVFIYINELGDINLSKELLLEKVSHNFKDGSHTMAMDMGVY